MSDGALELSVVVPVYGCEPCLRSLHSRLTDVLRELGVSYELIFVDDGSTDGAWRVLAELAAADGAVIALKLSRNFGQHPAITAGLTEARGHWTVVMDCDLQHPPEVIPRLYEAARAGYEIVFTQRRGRHREKLFRTVASKLYFRLMNAILGTTMNSDFSNFTIVSRPVREAFLSIHDNDRQYLMILYWLGFNSTTIEFEHQERFAGKSTYSMRTLMRFAFAGLFFQTTTLLRWTLYLGFALSAAGGGLAAFFVYNYFFGHPYPGWTSLGVLLLVIGGFVIVSTGLTGLYVGKIFAQVKDRPLYLVERRLCAASAELPAPVEHAQ